MPDRINSSSSRLRGYQDALEEQNVSFDKTLIYDVEPTIEAGYNTMKELLERETVESVFCGCDLIAVGVMECVLEKGFRIPEDIRIASYDDIEFAPYLKVPLTTVRQPTNVIGKIATSQLIEAITEGTENSANIVIRPEVIVREST